MRRHGEFNTLSLPLRRHLAFLRRSANSAPEMHAAPQEVPPIGLRWAQQPIARRDPEAISA